MYSHILKYLCLSFTGIAAPVGGAVAGVILVAVIIIVACYIIRRKKSEKASEARSYHSNPTVVSNPVSFA